MPILPKYSWVLAALLAPVLLHAEDKGIGSWPDGATVVQWQENGIRRQAWMAADKVAVFRGKRQEKAAVQPFINDVKAAVPEKDIVFMNPYVSVIRTSKSEAARYASPRAAETFVRRSDPDAPALPVSPVFYPQGQQLPTTRMALTGEIIVRFNSRPTPAELEAVENTFDLTLSRSVTPKTFLFQAASPWLSLTKANELQQSGMVDEATPHWYRARTTRQSNDPLAGQQWHLANTGQSGGMQGADAHVVPVWDAHRGTAEQVVAIVDGAVEIGHEDLQPNVRLDLNWNFVEDNEDPGGEPSDAHGTACAGIAAARGFNEIGVSGAAPWAGLAGIRLLGAETDLNEALALSHKISDIAIYSNSWGPVDDGKRLEGPGSLTLEAMAGSADSGRNGKGSIYVWAGGNGRQDLDNSNYDGYANLRQVLAIGATTDQGVQAAYSEPGANLLVNAPSNGGLAAITTADRTGTPGYSTTNYTTTFGGTSAAAPLVSGVIALMLEANPNLTWRDIRWILAHTAQHNDPTHSDWQVNGAGMWVNHSYGFGRIDAMAAVTMSANWSDLGPEQSFQALVRPGATIPDNDAGGLSSTIAVDDNFTIEFVDITFSAPDHPHWGDLEIVLTSPAGTQSVLAQRHSSGTTYRYDNWRFGSTRHLGENSGGTWTLTVRDLWAQDIGTFVQWQLEIHGHAGKTANPASALVPTFMLLMDN